MGTEPSRDGELARDARGGARGTALLLLQGWGLLQLTPFLKVPDQAQTSGECLFQAVDPGRNASPSWRAEGWDLNPALCCCCWAAPESEGWFWESRTTNSGFWMLLGSSQERGVVVLDSQCEVPKAALESTGSFPGSGDLTPLVLCTS